MKSPENDMTRKELVRWVYENDYSYYAKLVVECEAFQQLSCKEVLDELVVEVIHDAVYYQSDYNHCIAWHSYGLKS